MKADSKRIEKLGVIACVTELTEMIMVRVHKANEKMRIFLKPRNFTCYIQREHWNTLTRDEIYAQFANTKCFSKVHTAQRFWQTRLDDARSVPCTFTTPRADSNTKRLPFGIRSVLCVFHAIVHYIFIILDVDVSMNDIIVYSRTQEELHQRLRHVCRRCKEIGLKLNRSKHEIEEKGTAYLGDTLTGVK